MATFIHLSDLHLRSNNDREENRNCKELVEFIINNYPNQKPIILLTGDIVDDGYAIQYQNAVNLLKPLVKEGFKLLAVPGNHDYGPMGNFYTEDAQMNFQRYILGDLLEHSKSKKYGFEMEDLFPMVEETEYSVFIGLDSVVGKEDELLHFASGEVGKTQRRRLANILNHYVQSKKHIVVYFHHHPFDRRFVMEMEDAKKVMRLLAGKVDFLCFGHDHKSATFNGKHNIEWILASGRSTKKEKHKRLQFREVTIKKNCHSVAMISFKV